MQISNQPGCTANDSNVCLRKAAQGSRGIMTEEREMESYLIRIYRQGDDALAGVIEPAEGGGAWPFRSLDELRELLRAPLVAVRGGEHLEYLAEPQDTGDSTPAKRVNGEAVRLLHRCLRAMTTAIVDAPSEFPGAPGYYAVYFTDEPDGIRLEYVHVSG